MAWTVNSSAMGIEPPWSLRNSSTRDHMSSTSGYIAPSKGKRKLDSIDLTQGYDSRRTRTRVEQRNLISEQNAQESPFLQLPAEIRNQIYLHALGNKVIHISVRDCPTNDPEGWSYRGYYYYEERNCKFSSPPTYCLKFTHAICNHPHDEEKRLYELSRQATEKDVPSPPAAADLAVSYPDRHTKCYSTLATLKSAWIRGPGDHVSFLPRFNLSRTTRLPVALLRTCRQIHAESHHLLYPTNTFAFHEGLTLNLFLKTLAPQQRRQISTIQADGYLTGKNEVWSIELETAALVTGLRTLQVWFRWGEQFQVCGINAFSGRRRLKEVEMEVICGPNRKFPHSGDKGLRRRKAELVERDLRGEKLGREEKGVFEWDRCH